MYSYPRLKPGVQRETIDSRGDQIFVGLPTHGVRIAAPMASQIVRLFDGRRNSYEIATGLHLTVETVLALEKMLSEHSLLDLMAEKFQSPLASPSAQRLFRQQEIEGDLIAHRENRSDGGTQELRERAEYTILISGENRLARTLLSHFQAMGINHSRIITRGFLNQQITPDDVCGVTTKLGDVGKNRRDFHAEIARESKMVNGESVAKAKPDLIISTIPIEWDYVQRWMSESSTHLHINPIIGRHIEIGPLVVPGESACLRCVALTKRDLKLPVAYESLRTEMPTSTISLIAGVITSYVATLITTGSCALLGASVWIDLLAPLEGVEKKYWAQHVDCGCSD